jgi:hypothetical protein
VSLIDKKTWVENLVLLSLSRQLLYENAAAIRVMLRYFSGIIADNRVESSEFSSQINLCSLMEMLIICVHYVLFVMCHHGASNYDTLV